MYREINVQPPNKISLDRPTKAATFAAFQAVVSNANSSGVAVMKLRRNLHQTKIYK